MAAKDVDIGKLSLQDPTADWKDYLRLNMINDRRTEMYVKSAKVMVIFQGSVCVERKKATNSMAEMFKNASHIISDETYRREYLVFNPERTDEFHRFFKKEVKRACEEGSNLIVIDASLTHLQQLEYYFYLAQQFQYVILIVPPLVSVDVTNPEQFKNIKMSQAQSLMHAGAKLSSVGAVNHFEHYFCAWFLHEADSESLRTEASLYMQDCFENIERFAIRYNQVCTVENFRAYFNLDDRRQDLAFCVVTVFERLKKQVDFFNRKCVADLYGKMSKLTIIGFIITQHIIAARVQLTYKQKQIYDMPNDIDESFSMQHPNYFPTEKLKQTRFSFKENLQLVACKANPTLVNFGDPWYEPLKQVNLNARGRSSHIVLGKAPGAPALNVDYDVHFAVFRERRLRLTNPDAIEPVDIGRSIVFSIGRFWYIYLKQHLSVDGFLASCAKPELFKDT